MMIKIRAALAYRRAKRHWDGVRRLPIHREYDATESIFIHIPKTAGLSISHALYNGLESQHRDVSQMRIIFGNHDFERYFKFAFVREPIARFLSAYAFLKKGGLSPEDKEFCKRHHLAELSPAEFLDRFMQTPAMHNYIHFTPQMNYLQNHAGKIDVDYIGRYESLIPDFQTVARRLGKPVLLPEINRGDVPKSLHANTFHDSDKARIREFYQRDYQLLGY